MTLSQTRHSWQRKIAISICTSAMVAGLLPPVPVFAVQVTADSLVGYWKLDEGTGGSGSTLTNSSGDDGKNTFRPNDPINRAEVAKMIVLVLQLNITQ